LEVGDTAGLETCATTDHQFESHPWSVIAGSLHSHRIHLSKPLRITENSFNEIRCNDRSDTRTTPATNPRRSPIKTQWIGFSSYQNIAFSMRWLCRI
jgi:hypothetical protein